MTTQPKIKFTIGMDVSHQVIKENDAINYERICKTKNCFEMIPDDRPIKLYFDTDINDDSYELVENETILVDICNKGIIPIIKETLTNFLALHNIEPDFHIATSNGLKTTDKKGKSCWKISIHTVINNVITTKNQQLILVKRLNEYAFENKITNGYFDGKNETFKLFDESVYDKNRKLRSVYASKEGENRPLIIHEGNFEGLVISSFINENVFQLPDIPEILETKPVTESKNTIQYEGDKKYDKMYFDMFLERGALDKYYNGYDTWRTIGFMLRYEFGDNMGWKMLEGFSKRDSRYIIEGYDDKNRTFWNSLKDNVSNPVKMGTLINMVKKDNKHIYTEVHMEINRLKKEDKKQEIITKNAIENANALFVSNDNEAIDVIVEKIKDNFIYTKNQMYFKDGNRWVNDDNLIHNMLMKFILESEIYKKNDKNELVPYCQNVKTTKSVREGLLSKLTILKYDDLLYDKFHTTTKNMLCFSDGVLDLVNKSFTLWANIPEDKPIYTTVIINRNYENYFKNPNRDYIKKVSDDIFKNLFGENLNYALQFFSRAIGGNIEDKNFMSYCGNRNCGKGILYTFFEYTFSGYITSFNLENMTCKRQSNKSSDLAKENSWLIPLQYARIAISQETDENVDGNVNNGLKISNKSMKSIMSGGDIIKGRLMHKDAVDFTIDATLCVFGNNEIAFNGKDADQHHIKFSGVKQFVTQEQYDEDKAKYGASFVSSYAIRDDELKKKVKTEDYANALVYLLYENFINKCISVKRDETEENKNMSIRELIFANYYITNDDKDRISKEELYEAVNGDKKKIINELKELGCVGNDKCRTTVETTNEEGKVIKKQVQAFKGLKQKEMINNDSDNNEN